MSWFLASHALYCHDTKTALKLLVIMSIQMPTNTNMRIIRNVWGICGSCKLKISMCQSKCLLNSCQVSLRCACVLENAGECLWDLKITHICITMIVNNSSFLYQKAWTGKTSWTTLQLLHVVYHLAEQTHSQELHENTDSSVINSWLAQHSRQRENRETAAWLCSTRSYVLVYLLTRSSNLLVLAC